MIILYRYSLGNGKLMITPNHVYAGENRIDLTKDTNTVYTHPSEKQCSWEPNLSNYVTFDDLSNISPWTLLETYNDGDRFNVPDGYDLYFILVKAVCSSYDGCACGLRYNSNSYAIIGALYRGIAQLVEQRSPKPRVQSSSLCAPAI